MNYINPTVLNTLKTVIINLKSYLINLKNVSKITSRFAILQTILMFAIAILNFKLLDENNEDISIDSFKNSIEKNISKLDSKDNKNKISKELLKSISKSNSKDNIIKIPKGLFKSISKSDNKSSINKIPVEKSKKYLQIFLNITNTLYKFADKSLQIYYKLIAFIVVKNFLVMCTKINDISTLKTILMSLFPKETFLMNNVINTLDVARITTITLYGLVVILKRKKDSKK